MPSNQQSLFAAFSCPSRRALHINNRIAHPISQAIIHLQRQDQYNSISAPSFTQRRTLSNTVSRKMASDEDYMAFLNKANQDADEGRAAAQSSRGAGQQRAFKIADEGSELPKSIAEVIRDAFYVSEADEPFKGVSLKWKGEGGLPDEGQLFFVYALDTPFQDWGFTVPSSLWKEKIRRGNLCRRANWNYVYIVEFAKLINHWDAENAQIDIMDPVDWDSQGEYGNVIDAVREATKGNDVRVYRVARDLTRAEYFVISRDDE
ncbi:hypothetical protein M431DRAFT_529643 [Trichoderma harzianum CBS 226.95]|uniref:Uncharacterized protein n=1 Tax=Trichoderma harzianum CBS 226.95 TaxID=983964 RepID=A0A2T4AIH3_TRIHA|nr:hypothetical protein M431DRAFT_529643 [Trichoderma harzianum CBS 226.95]PTB56890.1 hypothetical protein M431DRAFT_529643 [Trichoderma harzianum CBS 226.95]